ncbi:MAG: redoxin domain-containing protein [Phycisphaerae bacterium]|nr:redoxin domain-containing protein [Phycisphaerae bacterium]
MKRTTAAIGLIWLAATASVRADAHRVQGVVVDGEGRPVRGAVVYVLDQETRLSLQDDVPLVSEHIPRALTGDDGRFRFERLVRPVYAVVAMDMEDRCGVGSDVSGDGDVRVVIEAPGTVAGRVMRGKSPQAGARVTAVYEGAERAFRYTRLAVSDADGRFTIGSLMPGRYRLILREPVPQIGCCLREVTTSQVQVDVVSGQTQPVQMGGSDLPHLHGRITDTENAPLHGVWIRLLPSAAVSTQPSVQAVWSAVTDREGRYTIYDVPPGSYQIKCLRRLYANSSRLLQWSQTLTVVDRASPQGPTEPFFENACDLVIDLERFDPLAIGDPAPELAGRTVDAAAFDLGRLTGKVVVVYFHASFCAACRRAVKPYDDMVEHFGPENLVVVGVSLDDTIEECREFIADRKPQHPQIFAGPWDSSDVAQRFRVQGVPATVLIDREGRIAAVDIFDEVLLDAVRTAIGSTSRTR